MDPQSGKVIQSCNLPDMPETRIDHTVDGNIVCGGFSPESSEEGNYFLDNCITLIGGEWKETHKLPGNRARQSSWQVCEGVVLLGSHALPGGITAELVEAKTGKSRKLFDLNYRFA